MRGMQSVPVLPPSSQKSPAGPESSQLVGSHSNFVPLGKERGTERPCLFRKSSYDSAGVETTGCSRVGFWCPQSPCMGRAVGGTGAVQQLFAHVYRTSAVFDGFRAQPGLLPAWWGEDRKLYVLVNPTHKLLLPREALLSSEAVSSNLVSRLVVQAQFRNSSLDVS